MQKERPKLQVLFQRLDERAISPVNAYQDDAGWDLHVLNDTICEPQRLTDVMSGIAVAIPEGYYGRIVGRSSTIRRKRLIAIEGIIDAGFRGELLAGIFNPGLESVFVEAGQSLVQLIVSPVPLVQWVETGELPYHQRGERGFGSSGR